MGRPARAIKRVTLSIRFEPDEIAAIDRARGSLTRQAWVHAAVCGVSRPVAAKPDLKVEGVPVKRIVERKPKPLPAKVVTGRQLADKMGVQIGPRRSLPGARLKP